MWAWGFEPHWSLGNGTKSPQSFYQSSPVQVPGLTRIMAVSSRFNYSAALKSDGTVWVWGRRSTAYPLPRLLDWQMLLQWRLRIITPAVITLLCGEVRWHGIGLRIQFDTSPDKWVDWCYCSRYKRESNYHQALHRSKNQMVLYGDGAAMLLASVG